MPMCDNASTGRVFFVGAGPGSGDLITLRGARRIAEADVVVWPSAAVASEVVREHARPEAELIDSARLGEEHLVRLYRQAAARRSTLVRLVPGDAAVWTGLQPHLDLCGRLGLAVEIVPGVAPLAAAVAATGRELADPAVLLTQFDPTRPRTPLATTIPAPGAAPSAVTGTGVPRFAGPGPAVVVSASASRTEALVDRLRAAGHPDAAPVTVVAKAGRPDEVRFSTTLGELDEAVKRHRLWVPALFLVGRAPLPSEIRTIQYSSQYSPPGPHPLPADAVPAGRVSADGTSAAAMVHRPYRRRRRTSQGGSA
jgi:precorrin-4/cobalt-precorrin-4 C11-methyltransferase